MNKKVYNIFFVISFWFLMIANMEYEKANMTNSKTNCERNYLTFNYICINTFTFCFIFVVYYTSSKTIYFI